MTDASLLRPGKRNRHEWVPNFYPSREVAGYRARVSRAGRLILLTEDEDAQIDRVFMDEDLFRRLEAAGMIITTANAQSVLEAVGRWQHRTYAGPGLHIVVLTKRCNLNCTYCHMNPEPSRADPSRFDLQPDTARRVVRFILDGPHPEPTIEFQGGEPFLNFEAMRLIVEEATALGERVGRRPRFTVVSNLMTATEAQLEFCARHGVNVSYTLNGNQAIHDRYRVNRQGKGSFAAVLRRVQDIQARHPGLLSAAPLCTISTETAAELREMIEFFRGLGMPSVSIQPLKPLGNARRNELPFDVHAYLDAYLDLLDYMYEQNRVGGPPFYQERTLNLAIAKIISDVNVGFVDWRNPCGDVLMALTYDHDGEILPSDEARSLRDEFSLGNVAHTTHAELFSRDETFRTVDLSVRDRDPVCRECAYNPYCGVLPVLEYARTGDAVPRAHEAPGCLFTLAVLDWTIRRWTEDPVTLLTMVPEGEQVFQQLLGLAPPPAEAVPAG